MITASILCSYWKTHYPELPPLGYILRAERPQLWFRIHSFRNWARHAKNEAEQAQMLARHNAMTSATMGVGEPFVVIFAKDELESGWGGAATLAAMFPDATEFLSWSEEDDPEYVTNFVFAPRVWSVGSLDELFVLIANGAIERFTLASLKTHLVYCPYEGGGDVFSIYEGALLPLKERFRSWLPPDKYQGHTLFADLLHLGYGGGAYADEQFPHAVTASELQPWSAQVQEDVELRLVLGVATYAQYELRLLDSIDQLLAQRRTQGGASLRVEVFNIQDCMTMEDFEMYVPGIRAVAQTAVLGLWRDGVLMETATGARVHNIALDTVKGVSG